MQVSACPDGKVVGQETAVRVFDVQHIKGLEFEAVFFQPGRQPRGAEARPLRQVPLRRRHTRGHVPRHHLRDRDPA